MENLISIEYKKAFSEVYDILRFTDPELTSKIPKKLYDFIENNRDHDIITNVNPFIPLENQQLSEETIPILALIYRNYMASEEEKVNFSNKDKLEFIENEKEKREKYNPDNIFVNSNPEKVVKDDKTETNTMMVIQNDSIYHKIVNKIKNFIKKLFAK